jgi:hypothetical protein
MRRTQIYLNAEQADELAARASRRGVTASHMIREAIDDYLTQPEDERKRLVARYRAALDRTFGAVPRLPDGRTYVEDLRRGDRERARDLEERRRR